MTDLNEIRSKRVGTYGNPPTDLAGCVVAHIAFCIRHIQSSAVLVNAAEQNVPLVRRKLVECVAQIDGWSHVDPDSYSSYEVACQSLYLNHNIMVRLQQKEMSSPDYSFTDFDVSGFNKVFHDYELNASDPYFNVIKRDYYNEVNS